MVEPYRKPFARDEAIKKLGHAQEAMRLAALGELLGAEAGAQTIEQVANCLWDSSERVRRASIVVLMEAGPGTVTALVSALDDKQPPAVRVLAASAVAKLGVDAAPAIDALIACLRADDEGLSSQAALALAKIGSRSVPKLRDELSSPNMHARMAAADALGHIGAAATEALSELETIMRGDGPVPLRLACAAAALKIGGDAKGALPVMLAALQSDDRQTRLNVLERLGQSRSAGQDAVPAMLNCLNDPAAEVRANAALALGRAEANAPEVIRRLTLLLSDSDAEVRLNAAIGLSAAGLQTSGTQDALQNAQRDPDARVAAAASAALRQFRGRAE